MNITEYQAKYFAHELTRRFAPDSAEKLAGAVAGAQVTLNPHQVDAALFAFSSPLSKGALLADEVGLGKTIEAGLVIAQRWAERKRRVLVITPSNLRNQWYQELTEKFFLPCTILETRSYNQALKAGVSRPFDQDETVIICSYQFACNKALDVQMTPWDLVVMDEAHRLRNVYKPTNVIANTLKRALAEKNKLLLTATPLQNSLLELYGLISFIDEHTFGDLKSFREQFAGRPQDRIYQLLRERLRPICHRTLRRQVGAYVQYTKRLPILEEFTPEEGEDRLYELVSDYLRRDNLQALPASQRALMTLVLRKLLASSTFAIAGALNSMSARLQAKLRKHEPAPIESELGGDYEALETTADEWIEDDLEPLTETDRKALEAEITDLNQFAALATSIKHNAKGKALLKALGAAFQKAENLGAAQKAIIFTESRRTQSYLLRILEDSPYAEGIVLFNGTNADEASKKIYAEWIERHQGSDRVTGSRTADMRSALVDYFRERGRIMIATEAAAEGINLQFCSLVVNYDLPWNPQRIEQRIGRCHRYGQKHDVVVVNFLNRKNEADQRVYELLSEKFKLFEGVFGASDEVLGVVESGVDFEKRIASIYQQCRQTNEIKTAFDQLQLELSLEINEAMTQTRQKLLENFDEEVREKLKATSENAAAQLDRFERRLMHVTRHELNRDAEFTNVSSFRLMTKPSWANGLEVPLGLYELPRRSGDAHLYRLAHPLGEAVIERAKSRQLRPAGVRFNYTGHSGKISILEPFVGKRGWLSASLFTVASLDQHEDHLLVSGVSAHDEILSADACQRLLTLAGEVELFDAPAGGIADRLDSNIRTEQERIQGEISHRNVRFFEVEAEKLDGWADDLKVGLEREIKEIDRQIKEARRAAASASTLEEKLKGQKELKSLETLRNQRRRSLFEAQDDIDRQRTTLIANIEGKLEQKTSLENLFLVSWSIV
jgi:adenine-specific DNA-methyltransferase